MPIQTSRNGFSRTTRSQLISSSYTNINTQGGDKKMGLVSRVALDYQMMRARPGVKPQNSELRCCTMTQNNTFQGFKRGYARGPRGMSYTTMNH